MNGYYGSSLGGGKLGKREQQNMKALKKRCDSVMKVKQNSRLYPCLNKVFCNRERMGSEWDQHPGPYLAYTPSAS